MDFEKKERTALLDALESAITTPDTLQEFVWRQLGTTLHKITGPAVLSVMIIQTVEWANASTKMEDLLQGAIEMFPDNLAVTRDLPPLLDKVRRRPQQEATQASIRQLRNIQDLPALLNNLNDLVKALQQMLPTTDPDATRVVLEAGKRAIKRMTEQEQIPSLTEEEQTGLETIVLAAGRPALLVQNGDFSQPPGPWRILEKHRATIRRAIAATGRIEMLHGPHPWIGTGFLVGPTVVAVPDYMASMFGEEDGNRWKLQSTLGVQIDFLQEYGSAAKADHAMIGIIGVDANLGVAFLEVDSRGHLPPPLTLAADKSVGPERNVYLVGYPSRDSRRPDEFMRGVLENISDVKRLCPGKILKASSQKNRQQKQSMLAHDCTSSGGMGGAPLVDLETGNAIGLHYAARYLEAGYAQQLSLLHGTRLSLDANMTFA